MRRKKKQSVSRERKSKINFKQTVPLLAVFIMIIALLWGVRWIVESLPGFKIFRLQNCYVEGRNIKLSGKEAFNYCILSQAGSLLEIDLETLRDKISRAHLELKRVTVKKDYPDTIRVVVEERRPFAQIRADDVFVVDEEGFVLSKNSGNIQESLPVIIGVTSRYIKKGVFNQNASLKKAIEILKIVKASQVKYVVEKIDISNPDSISFFIMKDVEIKLGRDDFKGKIEKMEIPLSNLDLTQIKYIDLRFEDLIVGPR